MKPITNVHQAFLESRRGVPVGASPLRNGIVRSMEEANLRATDDAVGDVEWRIWGWRFGNATGPVRRALADLQAYRVELGLEGSGVLPPPERLHPITTRGRRFYAGGQPFDWREASQFMLLKRVLDGEDIRDDLRWWKAKGITMLRVLGMVGHPFWLGWEHGPTTPGYLTALETLCQSFGDVGLYLRFTIFADLGYVQLPGSRVQHVQAVDEVLKRHSHVVVEIANEPSLNGFSQGESSELAELALKVSPLVALGAEHGKRGHLDTYDVHPAHYVTFHAERATWEDGWAWPRRLGEYGVVGKDGARPVVSGEPINAGDKGNPNDFEPNPAVWFAYGALSRIVPEHGYAPCFHFHDGLYAKRPTGVTLECLDAFLQGCDAVPISALDQQYTNGHWTASPWHGFDQTDPPSDDRPSRIYGRGAQGSYLGVALRHRPGWRWTGMRYPVERVAEVGPAHGRKFAASVWRAA